MNQILKDAVYRVLLQYAHIAIGVQVVLKRFELHQGMARGIANHKPGEIGQPCPGTDSGKLFGIIDDLGC